MYDLDGKVVTITESLPPLNYGLLPGMLIECYLETDVEVPEVKIEIECLTIDESA